MMFPRNYRIDGRGWHRVLIIAAICSLTVTLAARFSLPIDSASHAVKSFNSRSDPPKRQHLDQDSARFARPAACCTFYQPAAVHAHVSPAEPPQSSHILAQSLYNRPPPATVFSL
jgi:hypothetical protein